MHERGKGERGKTWNSRGGGGMGDMRLGLGMGMGMEMDKKVESAVSEDNPMVR